MAILLYLKWLSSVDTMVCTSLFIGLVQKTGLPHIIDDLLQNCGIFSVLLPKTLPELIMTFMWIAPMIANFNEIQIKIQTGNVFENIVSWSFYSGINMLICPPFFFFSMLLHVSSSLHETSGGKWMQCLLLAKIVKQLYYLYIIYNHLTLLSPWDIQ